jgi:predicted negative regulator of RcsB-dependent stress response
MAIDDLLDEHEQSERVRSWLRNNGAGLIGGVALGLAVIFGWQWWQKDRQQSSEQANQAYETAVASISGTDLKKAEASVASLNGKQGVYADLAALRLAKAQVDGGQRDAAIATLRAIKPDPALQPVVQQRLARLLIDAGKHDEAIKLIGDAKDSASLVIRGDALAAGGKQAEARDAYTRALTGLDVASPLRRLVELKLADVGGTPPKSGDSV